MGSTEFIDDDTASQVSSCTTDLHACNEIQILTTDSTLSPVFAELFGANTLSGLPNFYPESNTGNFQFVLQYPIAGRWELTTAGAEQEQFSELECQTPWLNRRRCCVFHHSDSFLQWRFRFDRSARRLCHS